MSRRIELLRTIDQVRAYEPSGPLGFVPTMGYMHEGHLSLIRRAREECSNVLVSIFVNPTQFGPSEDLDRYPRDLDRDLELAGGAGADAVFAPSAEDMYPEGFTTEVRVKRLGDVVEGAVRPGLFAGIATVVAKLLNIVEPDSIYMGQKDGQQAIVIGRMIEDLNFPVRLVVCPTIREEDGLAMSSRNVYLRPGERAAAAVISRALFAARESGVHDPRTLEDMVRKEIQSEPLSEIEYVSANDATTLEPVTGESKDILLSCAVRIGKTRLVDNVVIGTED